MRETTQSYNFPEESNSFPKNSNKQSAKKKVPTFHKNSLYPVDEIDEFYDPFSDLNLFLAQKIKSTVKKHGSAKKWSLKIQNELLSGILPEFKNKFPHYRLGLTALKKVWEKVSYYYGKISDQKEALLDNGSLNVHYIIKQNVKDYLFKTQNVEKSSLMTAHKLAVKLSECIATIEGKRPKVDELTKMIWSVQKHLVPDVSIQQSKTPFEEYDNIDKLIVKILLEKTSEKNYSYFDLKKALKRKITKIKNYVSKYTSQEIYEHIARQLAQDLYPLSNLFKQLSEKELSHIEEFILFQIETNTQGTAKDLIELSQRIIAIYPLITALSKNLSLQEKKQAISYLLLEENLRSDETMNTSSSLYIFLTTEIHFIRRKKLFSSYQETEKYLLKMLSFSTILPQLQDHSLNDLEVCIWKMYNTLSYGAAHSLIANELHAAILDKSHYSFQNTVYQVLHFFQKAKKAFSHLSSEDEIDQKIEIWAIQNDMLCRYLHFDPHHPLLNLMEKLWDKGKTISHQKFIEKTTQAYLKERSLPTFCLAALKTRLWIFYKFFWYNKLTQSSETTFQRFIKWHQRDIAYSYPTLKTSEQQDILEKRVLEKLPITPFSRKDLEKI